MGFGLYKLTSKASDLYKAKKLANTDFFLSVHIFTHLIIALKLGLFVVYIYGYI